MTVEPTRITYTDLEEDFEVFVDRAAEGETFVFEHNGKDFILTGTIK
jgi:hypothetical protein